MYRCQWPRVLRRGSASARLLGFGFESRRGHGYLSLVSVVFCEVEVSASGWSLVQRSPTECGVSECDREDSIMRRPWPIRGCCAMGGKNWRCMMINESGQLYFLLLDECILKLKYCHVYIITFVTLESTDFSQLISWRTSPSALTEFILRFVPIQKQELVRPFDEGLTPSQGLYLGMAQTHTSLPSVGLKPTISVFEMSIQDMLLRAATVISQFYLIFWYFCERPSSPLSQLQRI